MSSKRRPATPVNRTHLLLLLLSAVLLAGGKLPTRCGVCDAGFRGASSAMSAVPGVAWTKTSEPARCDLVFSESTRKKRVRVTITVAQAPARFEPRAVEVNLDTHPPVVAPASCKRQVCLPVNMDWIRKCKAENPDDQKKCSTCYTALIDTGARNGYMKTVVLLDPQGKKLDTRKHCGRHVPSKHHECASPGYTVKRRTSTSSHASCDKGAGRCTIAFTAELRPSVTSCEGITNLLTWEGKSPPALDRVPCTPELLGTVPVEVTATIRGPRSKEKSAPPADLSITVQVSEIP